MLFPIGEERLWWRRYGLETLEALSVIDPIDGQRRRIRYGDVAILAVSTWRLSLLFPKLDAEGIPYASRGGTLFLTDPLHRQFLLGLRLWPIGTMESPRQRYYSPRFSQSTLPICYVSRL